MFLKLKQIIRSEVKDNRKHLFALLLNRFEHNIQLKWRKTKDLERFSLITRCYGQTVWREYMKLNNIRVPKLFFNSNVRCIHVHLIVCVCVRMLYPNAIMSPYILVSLTALAGLAPVRAFHHWENMQCWSPLFAIRCCDGRIVSLFMCGPFMSAFRRHWWCRFTIMLYNSYCFFFTPILCKCAL